MARAALGALLVAVAACASSDGDEGASSGSSGAADFCAGWDAALTSGDDDALSDLLRDAPPEIADAAAIGADDSSSEAARTAAGEEILDWVEVNCAAGPGDEGTRYLAPPPGADVAGLALCSAGTPPPLSSGATGSVVLYGEADRADPYDGPMLGVFSNDEEQENHAGDGDSRPVEVRGTDGVSAPITVFQQTILEELGTVIAWTEDGLAVGLYGRFWTDDRTDQLVELANSLELVDGRFELPADVLPDGYEEVYAGPATTMSLLFGFGADYEVRYQSAGSPGGFVQLAGWTLDEEEFDAFRFLTLGLRREESGGRDAVVGSAWSEDEGPWVVTWREPDGLVVRVVGLGVDQEQVHAVAAQARELDRAEWVGLIEAPNECPALAPQTSIPPSPGGSGEPPSTSTSVPPLGR